MERLKKKGKKIGVAEQSTEVSFDMDNPIKELLGALQRLYLNGNYSDFTISCGGKDYQVHKAIVCSRSDFFAAACHPGFKEAEEGIIRLPDDEAQAVQLMVYYLYHLEYDVSHIQIEGEAPREIGWELLVHVEIYILADKYGISDLKNLAHSNFKTAAATHWDSHSFIDAVREAYNSTMESDRQLRDAIITTFQEHADLLDKEEAQEVLKGVPMLAFDLLMFQHRMGNGAYWNPNTNRPPSTFW